MLVDNKFLFLKIPRTATVAFERSCFSAGLSITYPADNVLAQKQAEKAQMFQGCISTCEERGIRRKELVSCPNTTCSKKFGDFVNQRILVFHLITS
jgi:hypothetical protein